MYTAPLCRPPSEADSLILQLTLGCSYHQRLFCSSFRNKPFRTRLYADIVEYSDLDHCVFRANHPSNYYNFSATLSQDKPSLLSEIAAAMSVGIYSSESGRLP
jgi:hypothetical protein